MSFLLEPTKIALNASAQLIKTTASVLLDHFNVNNFWYYRIHESGRFSFFEASAGLLECLESQQFILKYPLCCHPKYHRHGTQIRKITEDPLLAVSETTKDGLLQLDFNLRVRLVNKTDDFVEEFGFHSAQSNDEQCLFLSNHLPELRFFAKWFLKNNARLISFLEESSLHLPSLVGPDFYKNRIQEADSSYQVRQKFLEKLGVKQDLDLSLVELDTLKLLLKGYTAPQIATQLYRSKRTIEHRIENIKSKLQCPSRVELIQKARELEHFGYSIPYVSAS